MLTRYCRDLECHNATTASAVHLIQGLGLFMHAYTLYWSVRPFGCTALLGCVDQAAKKVNFFIRTAKICPTPGDQEA